MSNLISARDAAPDERVWAALSHGSALLFGWGFFLPLIVWISQRGKSAFVAFHALQALTYQLLQSVYWTMLTVVLTVAMIVAIFAEVAIEPKGAAEPSPFIGLFMPAMFMIGLFGGMGLYVLVGMVGGVLVLARRDFQYPVLGRWMRRYLEPAPDGEVAP